MLHAQTNRPALPGQLTPDQGPIYASGEMRIGKHFWRAIVTAHPIYGYGVEYEWRYENGRMWHPARLWSGYDPDHYAHGLPARLEALYEDEMPILARFVPGIAAKMARQAQQRLPI